MTQAQQALRGEAVAAGQRGVVRGLGAQKQALVIVAGEVKSAPLGIFEADKQAIRQRLGEMQVVFVQVGLRQLQAGGEQKCVIVEIRIESRLALAVGGE